MAAELGIPAEIVHVTRAREAEGRYGGVVAMRVRAYLFATKDLEYVERSLGACAHVTWGSHDLVADELGIPTERPYSKQYTYIYRQLSDVCDTSLRYV